MHITKISPSTLVNQNTIHELESSWIEIDTKAIEHNITTIKNCINGKNIAAVIKCNAYGHGILPLAQICEKNTDISLLCVSNLSEALFLRSKQIQKPILVLSLLNADITLAFEKNIAIMVDDLSVAKKINSIAKKHNTYFPVHVKIDTGLARHGVLPEHFEYFLQQVVLLKNIKIEGVYSHYSNSGSPNDTSTEIQTTLFLNCVQTLKKYGLSPQHIHIANSAGILAHPMPDETTLVRIGKALYGYWPSDQVEKKANRLHGKIRLQPILSWKTKITRIKTVPENKPIGYGNTFYTKKNSKIGIIPVGFAHGLDQRWAKKGVVWINNSYAPIVGKIGMDCCAIDITNVKDVQKDSIVTILGTEKKITPAAIARACNITNISELLIKINPNIQKVIL